MRSAGQIPLSRALDNARKEAAVRYSGTAANGATETISPLIFHPAFPIQPPPLRGTSFHRKEGVSTQACTCQQKLDTKLKKLGIKIEYLYKMQ